MEVVYGKTPDFRQIRKDTGIPVSILKSFLLPENNSPGPSDVFLFPDKKRGLEKVRSSC